LGESSCNESARYQVQVSYNSITSFLLRRQISDSLRRFAIRYSCSSTVCQFVVLIGADKPPTYLNYRDGDVMHRLSLGNNALITPIAIIFLVSIQIRLTNVSPALQWHTVLGLKVLCEDAMPVFAPLPRSLSFYSHNSSTPVGTSP